MKNEFNFKSKISKEDLNTLPRHKFTGQIYHIDSYADLKNIYPLFKDEPVLGFDTETRPSFKKGKFYKVSLLQISTTHKAYLFRLNKMGLPDELTEVLSNPDIHKAGVAIHDDISALRKLNDFQPRGFIELQNYVNHFGIEDKGLKKLTANILGFQISKKQQTSNWEIDNLTRAQLEYAATDAWVCFEIYSILKEIKRNNGREVQTDS